MRKFAIIACSALALCGCASFGSTGTTALQDAEKALTAAHAAHDAAAVTLTILANNGVLKGANATTAQSYLDQSEQDLIAADKAEALGSATTIAQEVAAADALVQQVAAITGKN